MLKRIPVVYGLIKHRPYAALVSDYYAISGNFFEVGRQRNTYYNRGDHQYDYGNANKNYRNADKNYRNNFMRKKRNSFDNIQLEKPDWNKVDLSKFDENPYVFHEHVTGRDPSEIETFRNENHITIQGDNIPNPILSFEESNFSPDILKVIEKSGFIKPTPIQAQAWPIILCNQNIVGIGQTGSGKTLGYILPAIMHINNQPPLRNGEGPIVLVLAPTRELALQIQSVTKNFRSERIRETCVYGGASKEYQADMLLRGVEICIATPGRLLHFLEERVTNLHRCTYVVLDEADRMLDMGFEPQIRAILEQVRPQRQILMWSATWPKEIQSLARSYLNNYTQLTIGSKNLAANHNIHQTVYVCEEHEKYTKLCNLVQEIKRNGKNGKIIIFANTQLQVEKLARNLRNIWNVLSLHGRKTQSQRNEVLSRFRNEEDTILIATDVAARGLDVNDVTCVINFDYPMSTKDYIHRIGRTGRLNNKGSSYVFFTPQDAAHVTDLIDVLKEANQDVTPELVALIDKPFSNNFNNKNFWRNGPYNRPAFNYR